MTLKRHHPKRGRKTFYLAEYADLAYSLALRGRTDAQMAAAFSVSESTYKNWVNRHPEFREAIRRGKDIADAQVARALFDLAIGREERTVRRTLEPTGRTLPNGEPEMGVVQEVREYVAPDAGACKLWLRNRCDWKVGDATATATAHAVAGSVSVVSGVSDDVLERMREAGRAGNWKLADDAQPTLTADAEPSRELQPA